MGNNLKGAGGEKAAAAYLQKKGYIIRKVNFRSNGCEVDIIAEQEGTIVFIEVKTRTGTDHGYPEQAVNKYKKRNIARAAEDYIFDLDLHNEIRFDIISVLITGGGYRFYHIEDAFCP